MLEPGRKNLTNSILQVLWYSPGVGKGNNQYGNVTFAMDWKTMLGTFGPNIYYLDQQRGKEKASTRILIAKSNYDQILKPVPTNEEGSPLLFQNQSGRHLVSFKKKDGVFIPHELQIAFEVDDQEGVWLFSMSQIITNDHFCINIPLVGVRIKRKDGRPQRYKLHKCFKYNTSNNALCPFQFLRDHVKEKLNSKCPDMIVKELEDLLPIEDQNEKEGDMKLVKSNTSEPLDRIQEEIVCDYSSTNSSLDNNWKGTSTTLDELILKMKFDDIDDEISNSKIMEEHDSSTQVNSSIPSVIVSHYSKFTESLENIIEPPAPGSSNEVPDKEPADYEVPNTISVPNTNSISDYKRRMSDGCIGRNDVQMQPIIACQHCKPLMSEKLGHVAWLQSCVAEAKDISSLQDQISPLLTLSQSQQAISDPRLASHDVKEKLGSLYSQQEQTIHISRQRSFKKDDSDTSSAKSLRKANPCLSSQDSKPVHGGSKGGLNSRRSPSRTLYKDTFASSLKCKNRGANAAAEVRRFEDPSDTPLRNVTDSSYYRLAAYPSLL